MSYTVKIYINSSGPDYISKSLAGETSIDCEFKAPVDIENPTIYISGGASYDGYNYCYISEFGRYYFMTPVAGTAQTLTFECKSDPLMSFAAEILACPAVISRNPWHWDKYLHDPKIPVETRTISAVVNFPEDYFKGTNNCYILTTLGG